MHAECCSWRCECCGGCWRARVIGLGSSSSVSRAIPRNSFASGRFFRMHPHRGVDFASGYRLCNHTCIACLFHSSLGQVKCLATVSCGNFSSLSCNAQEPAVYTCLSSLQPPPSASSSPNSMTQMVASLPLHQRKTSRSRVLIMDPTNVNWGRIEKGNQGHKRFQPAISIFWEGCRSAFSETPQRGPSLYNTYIIGHE